MTSTKSPAQQPLAKRVVVVNGDPAIIDLLDTTLDRGRYDIVFADAGDRAYSTIRKTQPDLVILCTSIDDTIGFQLMTMLKMDPVTRLIPIVTYTDGEAPLENNTPSAPSESDALPTITARPSARMN
jgi:CheY-like chemotaxis protein